MIFAAGKGTRLYPLTKNTPKALVQIAQKPMLEWQILKLIKLGIKNIIINIHHFPNQIIDFVKSNNSFGIDIQFSDESDNLLDTGGGLKKASWFFKNKGPHILQNVDIFSDIEYQQLINYHNNNNALATLVVKKRKTSRYLLFDKKYVLCGWENLKTGEKIITKKEGNLIPLAFSGIHIVDSSLFELINEQGVFSIIDLYLRLSRQYIIKGYVDKISNWFDLGKVESIQEFKKSNYSFI